jgi:hypothetical protein
MKRLSAAAILVSIAAGTPAFGHHSFSMFDGSKTLSITATVKKFDWTNPHVYIDVVVTGADGAPQTLSLESPSVSILTGLGWTRTSLQAGDQVSLVYNPMKGNAPGGALVTVTTPAGKVLGVRAAPAAGQP